MVTQETRQDGSIGNKIISFSKATKELPKYDDSEFAEKEKLFRTIIEPPPEANNSGSDFVAEMDAEAAKAKAKVAK